MQTKSSGKSSLLSARSFSAIALALAAISFSACTTTPPPHETSQVDRHEVNRSADAALAHLYQTVPGSHELIAHAKGVLILPAVLEAGFVVGGEYGKGILRVGETTDDYYRLTAGSVGWQAGAQSKAVFLLFMTQDSLDQFRRSNGWEAGADATVALATIGANGNIDTNTAKQPVIGFVMTNSGLMAGVTLQGAKFSRIAL